MQSLFFPCMKERDKRGSARRVHHGLLPLKEVVLKEPFKDNNGSKEKGALWSKIADALTQYGMKVTQRSARERFDKLYSDYKERERQDKQASGIDVNFFLCLRQTAARQKDQPVTMQPYALNGGEPSRQLHRGIEPRLEPI